MKKEDGTCPMLCFGNLIQGYLDQLQILEAGDRQTQKKSQNDVHLNHSFRKLKKAKQPKIPFLQELKSTIIASDQFYRHIRLNQLNMTVIPQIVTNMNIAQVNTFQLLSEQNDSNQEVQVKSQWIKLEDKQPQKQEQQKYNPFVKHHYQSVYKTVSKQQVHSSQTRRQQPIYMPLIRRFQPMDKIQFKHMPLNQIKTEESYEMVQSKQIQQMRKLKEELLVGIKEINEQVQVLLEKIQKKQQKQKQLNEKLIILQKQKLYLNRRLQYINTAELTDERLHQQMIVRLELQSILFQIKATVQNKLKILKLIEIHNEQFQSLIQRKKQFLSLQKTISLRIIENWTKRANSEVKSTSTQKISKPK